MKKFVVCIIFLLFFSRFAAPAFAADDQGNKKGFGSYQTPKPKETVRPTDTNKAYKTQTVVNRTLDSYQKRLNQYKDFLTKVKARRDKLAAAGKDVTRLDAFIATATAKAANAQSVLDNAKSVLGALDYSGDMKTIRKTVQDELKKVRLAFTDMHKSMSDTVSDIKALTAGIENPKPTRDQKQNEASKSGKKGGNGNQNGGGNSNND